MKILELIAKGSNLSICDDGSLVSKNVNYHKCSFSFDSDWEDLTKTAVFWQEDATYHTLLDEDNVCTIPSEVLKEGVLYIGVFGTDITGKIINTNPVYIRVFEGCLKDGETPPVPTPGIYAQVLSLIKTGGYTPQKCTVTLKEADWDADIQTVNIEGVTENNIVVISPVPTQENISYYQSNGVWCFAQGNGTLMFMRNRNNENENLYVNVLIYPESEGTV